MKKKSIKKSAVSFRDNADEILHFLNSMPKTLKDEYLCWIHDYAIIRLYKEFEVLMLDVLIGAINNDTTTLSSVTGVTFPKDLNGEVCEFLVTGVGYFDFKGRDGLIKKIGDFVPDSHYAVQVIKKPKYKQSLDQLTAFRNFAAHNSPASKNRVLAVLGQKNIASSGSWLKRQNRYQTITNSLEELAQEIHDAAPY